ncbi:hypothetical protein BC827DRAFT_1264361 [Russula dissimulans]|nr:hypothetical protein BC827DRAFT_1264361 [Russula dissimulans]
MTGAVTELAAQTKAHLSANPDLQQDPRFSGLFQQGVVLPPLATRQSRLWKLRQDLDPAHPPACTLLHGYLIPSHSLPWSPAMFWLIYLALLAACMHTHPFYLPARSLTHPSACTHCPHTSSHPLAYFNHLPPGFGLPTRLPVP